MNIQSISKAGREATVRLTAEDLVKICNALWQENNKDSKQLYSDLMIARDLCQYGHIDNFTLGQIVKERGVENVLPQNKHMKGDS